MRCRILIVTVILSVFFYAAHGQTDTAKKTADEASKALQEVKKGCSDAACHGNLLNQEVVHHPVKRGDCEKCHTSNGSAHPQANAKGFVLAKTIPALCYKCHDENNTAGHVHTPVKNGNCLECHNPHNSPESNLLVANPTQKLCEKCHTLESAQKAVKHQPVVKGECIKCHEPHQSENNKLLNNPSPALCLKCHSKQDEEMKMANVHPPFQNNCLNCHAHHSASEEKLLNVKTQNLCVYCHDEMQKRIETSPVVHGAITEKKSCVNCHSPHASNEKKFLLADVNHLCLKCHDRGYTVGNRKIKNIAQTLQKSKSNHQAIYKNGCTGCHDPHTSMNPNLLKRAFPNGTYSKATKENFALCFECHKSEILDKNAANATNFRNGDVNLHYMHINGEKGRSCTVCHDPHGAPNDKLINDKAPFGSWDMPLKYQKVENGGSCSPGCHVERKYERTTAIKTEMKKK
jgi:predicted CXXCH cytochrome family protein